jgi:hypothetical protein
LPIANKQLADDKKKRKRKKTEIESMIYHKVKETEKKIKYKNKE